MQNGVKFLLGGLLLFSTSVMAKELHNTYSIALVGMSMDYKEYTPQLADSEASTFTDIGGFEMSYGYKLSNESKINFSVMYVTGYSDYVGSRLGSANTYGSLTSRTVNNIVDTALSYNRYNDLENGLSLNYGLGFAYRYWERQLSVSQIEGYEWFSLRPSIGLETSLFQSMSLGIQLEYQYAINPKMSISANRDNQATSLNLGAENTWKISLPLQYEYNSNIIFFTTYSLEYQKIYESNSIVYTVRDEFDNIHQGRVVEPDSTAYNQYLKLGVTFKY